MDLSLSINILFSIEPDHVLPFASGCAVTGYPAKREMKDLSVLSPCRDKISCVFGIR